MNRQIGWLKFYGVREIAPVIAEQLSQKFPRIGPAETLQQEAVIVPIPLHWYRQRQRGFNQCELIAQELAKQTQVPYQNILTRKKNTLPQAQLSADKKMRQKNLANSFALKENLFPRADWKTAIIIDDVTTSGSTLQEAAKALRKLKFRQIWGLTLARG